jgi:GTPase Era involved in 16S rRNA processing
MIKLIGTKAREKIEKLLGTKVYLNLQAKVERKWNRREDKIEKMVG